ncbi:metallophosphoesterase [Luteolibacter sp. LG18]|uniref:metallophosphoesterase family protein n=1 Tax=Luteolibacter sp. LG18 TaxID=2819286 RepID=UPI002B28814A|nr:hypothetical protein llg_40460 [Luteolibacter sp. LG18]
MVVLVIADDECLLNELPVQPADVLVSCGDVSDSIILKAAERCGARRVLAVKGNHDTASVFPPPIENLHLNVVEVDGFTFGGFRGAWRYKPRGYHLFDQSDVELALIDFPAVDIFVGHNSPAGIHDRDDDDVHFGFRAFNRYIEVKKPRLLLHGHQHVNAESQLNGTGVIGVYGHRFITL